MVAGGAAAAGVCAVRRRGWKSVPVAMLAGGMWAIIPDLPRVIREDLPNTYLASTLGSRALGHWLNSHGNWFVFHGWFDRHYAQPWPDARWGLRGIAMIVVFYNVMAFTLFRANDRLAAIIARLKAQVANVRQMQMPDVSDAAVASDENDRQVTRRRHVRVSSRDLISAIVQHPVNHALESLASPALIDISSQGLAISTTSTVESGSLVYVRPSGNEATEDQQVTAVVLERMGHEEGYKLRCRALGHKRPTHLFKQAA